MSKEEAESSARLEQVVASLLDLAVDGIDVEVRRDSETARPYVRVAIEVAEGQLLCLRLFRTDAMRPERAWFASDVVSLAYDPLVGGGSPLDVEPVARVLKAIRSSLESTGDSELADAFAALLGSHTGIPGDPEEVELPRWQKAVGFYHEAALSGVEEDILELAIDIGILHRLAKEGPMPPAALATATGTNAFVLRQVLRVLACMDLVSFDASDRVVLETTPEELLNLLEVLAARWEMRHTLSRLVRSALASESLGSGKAEDEQTLWKATHRVMSAVQDRDFARCVELAKRTGPLPGETLLDVGAGSGHHAAAFASIHEDLKVVAVDYPIVVPRLREGLKRLGFVDRIRVEGGEFFEDAWSPPRCDAALFANTMHVASPSENLALLIKLREALGDTGRLIVVERVEVPGSISNATNGLTWSLGRGKQYRADEIHAMIAEAGFRVVDSSTSGEQFEVVAIVDEGNRG